MDWKKVKIMLIILFFIINVFLVYMLYNKNFKSYVNTIESIKIVFEANNVTLIPNINKMNINKKMQKLYIVDNDGLSEDLLVTQQESESYTHIGKKRLIVDIAELLSNFIRDNAPKDLVIKDIYLGYFYNSSKINDNITSGEAEPCWIIETNNNKYIYNAYTGEFLASK